VFLQRYDEDTAADNDQYRTAVNRTAATVVLEWMRKDQDAFTGLENEADDLEDIFYEIRAVNFEPPTDDVARLLDAKRSQDAAEETLTELEGERSELSTAIDQLAAGIDARQIIRGEDLVAAEEVESSEEPLEDGMRPVPKVVVTAFDRAREVASNITPAGSRMESIESQLEEHQARRSFSFHDRIDGERLQRAVFLAAVEDVVRSALTNHEFSSKVRDFVDEQEAKITEFYSAFEPTATPKEQFIQSIEPLLEQQLETLEGRLGEFGLADRLTNLQEYAELKRQRDRTRSVLDSFQRAKAEFDHLTQLAEELEEARWATVTSLGDAREEVTAVKSDVEAGITRVRQERAAATRTASGESRRQARSSTGWRRSF
jgi:chromosome segregation ATPase